MKTVCFIVCLSVLTTTIGLVCGQSTGTPFFEVLATLKQNGTGRALQPAVFCNEWSRSMHVKYDQYGKDGLAKVSLVNSVLTRGADHMYSGNILTGDSLSVDLASNTGYLFNYTYMNRLDLESGKHTGALFVTNENADVSVVYPPTKQIYYASRKRVRRTDLSAFNAVNAFSANFEDGFIPRHLHVAGSALIVFMSTVYRPSDYLNGSVLVLNAGTLKPLQNPIPFWSERFPNKGFISSGDMTPVVVAEDVRVDAWYVYFHGHLFAFQPSSRKMTLLVRDLVPDDDFVPHAMAVSLSGRTLSIGGRDGNGIATVLTLTRPCANDMCELNGFQFARSTAVASDSDEVMGACALHNSIFAFALQSTSSPRIIQVNLDDGTTPSIAAEVKYPLEGISAYGSMISEDDEVKIRAHVPVSSPGKGIAIIDLKGPMGIQKFVKMEAGFAEPLFLQGYDSGRSLIGLVAYHNGSSQQDTGVNYLARIDAETLQVVSKVPIGGSSLNPAFRGMPIGFDPSRRYFVFSFASSITEGYRNHLYQVDLQTWSLKQLTSFMHYSGNFRHYEQISIIPNTFDAFVTETVSSNVDEWAKAVISRRSLTDYALLANVFQFDANRLDLQGNVVDPTELRFFNLTRNVANFGQIEVDLLTNQYTIVNPVPYADPQFSTVVWEDRIEVAVQPAGTFDTYAFVVANTTQRTSPLLKHAKNMNALFVWYSEGQSSNFVKIALRQSVADKFVNESLDYGSDVWTRNETVWAGNETKPTTMSFAPSISIGKVFLAILSAACLYVIGM